jgi:hypothetical protein
MKLRILFLAIVLLMLPSLAQAQCAMCRAVLESSENQSMAQGINDGIIYLMIFPYLAIGGIGFFVYRAYKKNNPSQ